MDIAEIEIITVRQALFVACQATHKYTHARTHTSIFEGLFFGYVPIMIRFCNVIEIYNYFNLSNVLI